MKIIFYYVRAFLKAVRSGKIVTAAYWKGGREQNEGRERIQFLSDWNIKSSSKKYCYNNKKKLAVWHSFKCGTHPNVLVSNIYYKHCISVDHSVQIFGEGRVNCKRPVVTFAAASNEVISVPDMLVVLWHSEVLKWWGTKTQN